MAKIRRIIRKLKPPRYQTLDEQLWPVIVATAVLGGFTMGSLLAYVPAHAERWYASVIPWLVITAVVTAGAITALTLIDNRTFRRSMQLAVLLGLLFHAGLLVVFIELEIFGKVKPFLEARRDLSDVRQQVTVPHYVQPQQRNRVRQDIARPVATESPEPPPEPERRPQELETAPVERQVPPLPDVEQTLAPSESERPEQPERQEIAPRFHLQDGQLSSRSERLPQPLPTTAATVAQIQPPAATAPRPQMPESAAERPVTPPRVASQTPPREATSAELKPSPDLARPTAEQAPQPRATTAPTMPRRIDPPRQPPRTETQLAEAPSAAKQTRPEQIRPATTPADQRMTGSPERTPQQLAPVPDAQQPAPDRSQPPELRTESRPELARTPLSVPNQQPRATLRTPLATAASKVSPEDALADASPAPQPQHDVPDDSRQTAPAVPVARATQAPAPSSDQMPSTAGDAAPSRLPVAPPAPQLARSETADSVRRAARPWRSPTETPEAPAPAVPASTPQDQPAPPVESLARGSASAPVAPALATTAEPAAPAPTEPPRLPPIQAPATALSAPPAQSAPPAPSLAAATAPRRETVSRPSLAADAVARQAQPAPASAAGPVSEQPAAVADRRATPPAPPRVTTPTQAAVSEPAAMPAPVAEPRLPESALPDVPLAALSPAASPRRQPAAPPAADQPVAEAVAPAVAVATDAPTATPRFEADDVPRQAAPSDIPTAVARATAAAASEATELRPDLAATRPPRGATAPTLASSTVSSPAPRQDVTSLPNLTAIAGDVRPQAAVQADSIQPQPSLASDDRQPALDPTAVRSQASLAAQAATPVTQIGPAPAELPERSDVPSIAPSAAPAPAVARAAVRRPMPESPAHAESPAVAEAMRGVGSPALEPARSAWTRGHAGSAGAGEARNLDRTRPAPDSPALLASASAQRPQSTQETPPGPSLSPQAAAVQRRAIAESQVPAATVPAQADAQIALTPAAETPQPSALSASAAPARADADAHVARLSAAAGTTEIDLGPTRLVSEGETGRGSGGGRPTLNFDTDAPRIARSSRAGGVPQAALATDAVSPVPAAPDAEAGGRTATPQMELPPTAVARTDAGDLSPMSGGPTRRLEPGLPTEVSLSPDATRPTLSQAELSEALPAAPDVGGGLTDEEEERKRRLARLLAAGRAAASPAVAAVSSPLPAGDGAPQGPAPVAETAETAEIARAASGQAVAMASPASRTEGTEAVAALAPSASRPETLTELPPGPALATAGPASAGRAERVPTLPDAVGLKAGAAASAPDPPATSPPLVASAATAAVARETSEPTGATASRTGAAAAVAHSDAGPTTGGTERPASDTQRPTDIGRLAAPQVARAGRPIPGAESFESAMVLPGIADGSADSRGAASEPVPMAEPTPDRPDHDAVADIGGRLGGLAADQTEPTPTLLSAGQQDRVPAQEALPGAEAAGGGSPLADLAAPQIARRSTTDRLESALASQSPASVAASPGDVPVAARAAAGESGPSPAINQPEQAMARPAGDSSMATAIGQVAAADGPESRASGGELLAADQYQRAEAVEGVPGPPRIGGGTASARRAAAGPSPPADTRATAVALAGVPDSAGAARGTPLAAMGPEAERLPGGPTGQLRLETMGALAGELTDADSGSVTGPSPGERLASPSTDEGPTVGRLADAGLPVRRAERTALPAGAAEVAMAGMPGREPRPHEEMADLAPSPGDAAVDDSPDRKAGPSGRAVRIAAPVGPGGLGAEPTLDVGQPHRLAVRDSVPVRLNTTRFVRREVGGLPEMSTAAVLPRGPFARRRPRVPGEGWDEGRASPPPLTEETIDLGLVFLVRQQQTNGSWSLQSIPGETASLVTDTGATALALLAFQGAGYNHREHQYADVVRSGIEFLLKHQKPDGDLFLPMDDVSNQSVWLYSHALAALALCEAYGMTQDPSLKEPAQKSLDFIIQSQHPERGGWRYAPQVGSDTSVSGWMIMALKSGELAGLEVPEQVYENIRQWLEKSQASEREPHLYRYNPLAPNTPGQAHGREPTKTMTSVGLLMRLYLGWRRDNPNMIRGARYLAENLPSHGTDRRPQRDTYYWYYATQVMFHMGGEYWQAWNERLHPLLSETQVKQGPLAGSWEPRGNIADRWAPHAGRLYVTTMNILSLEIYYRHLPLYEDTLR